MGVEDRCPLPNMQETKFFQVIGNPTNFFLSSGLKKTHRLMTLRYQCFKSYTFFPTVLLCKFRFYFGQASHHINQALGLAQEFNTTNKVNQENQLVYVFGVTFLSSIDISDSFVDSFMNEKTNIILYFFVQELKYKWFFFFEELTYNYGKVILLNTCLVLGTLTIPK